MSGRLSLVATPIGNLEDLSLRAIRVLREASTVLAEDTRHTRGLLEAHHIGTRLESLHEHSTPAQIERQLEALRGGAHLALVTDAGTPLVSDPGAALVERAIEEGIRVEPIPGPSAVLAAITVAGFPAPTFAFAGFLPRKGEERREALEKVRASTDAVVIFESPKRIRETLTDLEPVLGARRVAVARELTKVHEEVLRGTAAEVRARLAEEVRGEITVVIEGAAPTRRDRELPPWADAFVEMLRADGARTRTLADALALATGISKSDAYAHVLSLRGE